jgi:hypothetical protein
MIRTHTRKPRKSKYSDHQYDEIHGDYCINCYKSRKEDNSVKCKQDEVLSIGPDGLPQRYRIVYYPTENDPTHHKDMIPIYETCACCKVSVGRIEEELKEELDGHCLNCFKNMIGQAETGPFGEFTCPNALCVMDKKQLKELQPEKVNDLIKMKAEQLRSRKMRGKK